jgi:hypothetical protein
MSARREPGLVGHVERPLYRGGPPVRSAVWRQNSGRLVVRASTGTAMCEPLTDAQFELRYGSCFEPLPEAA